MFSYDPLTGDLTPLVASTWRGKNKGYFTWWVGGRSFFAHTLIWAIVTGEFPPETVDHKDLDGFNNRWENLRSASQAQQQANRRLFKNNKSGYRGVYEARNGRWEAQIRFDKKTRSLGTYDTPEAAAQVVQKAREAQWGEFARVA